MSYTQSSTRATRRATETVLVLASRDARNFQRNLEMPASRKVGPLHLTRTYCRLRNRIRHRDGDDDTEPRGRRDDVSLEL